MKIAKMGSTRQNAPAPGAITILDCRELDTASAHRRLGQEARTQIHKILTRRLDGMNGMENVIGQIIRARAFQAALNSKLSLPGLDEALRAAILQYQACVRAWAQGAGLDHFRHPDLPLAGEPVRAEDLATLLQEDEAGCQTGLLRDPNGGVILWHAEEDLEQAPGDRFEKFRLFYFRAANGSSACGFIYPDLLPGPTFGWQAGDYAQHVYAQHVYAQHDYAQAVDSLHARQKDLEDAILPNTLAWLSLYLGAQGISSEHKGRYANLVEILGPYQGGYSLTAHSKKNGLVSVEKVDFMNDQLAACQLGTETGSSLFQTNIIRDLTQPIGAEEQTSPENRTWNEVRQKRTERFLRVIRNSSEPLPLIFRMLSSRLGGESSYANRDVKATLVCQMDPQKTCLWVNGMEIK